VARAFCSKLTQPPALLEQSEIDEYVCSEGAASVDTLFVASGPPLEVQDGEFDALTAALPVIARAGAQTPNYLAH
jgi:hypothetical protein